MTHADPPAATPGTPASPARVLDTPSPVPVVRTARLTLRGWIDEDREPWHALHGDADVTRLLGPGPFDRPATDRMVDGFMREWVERGYGLWAVEASEPLPGWPWLVVGSVGFHTAPDDLPFAPAVEIGWRLARPAWGRGYATEAARAALQVGFDDLRLAEIVSFTVPANIRSRAVMERLGMIRDHHGDFDHPRLPGASPLRHHVLYRLSSRHTVRVSRPSQPS